MDEQSQGASEEYPGVITAAFEKYGDKLGVINSRDVATAGEGCDLSVLLQGTPEALIWDEHWRLVYESNSVIYWVVCDGVDVRLKEYHEQHPLDERIARASATSMLLYRIMFLDTADGTIVIDAIRDRCTAKGNASDLSPEEAATVVLGWCWLPQRLLPAVKRALGLGPHESFDEIARAVARVTGRAREVAAMVLRDGATYEAAAKRFKCKPVTIKHHLRRAVNMAGMTDIRHLRSAMILLPNG